MLTTTTGSQFSSLRRPRRRDKVDKDVMNSTSVLQEQYMAHASVIPGSLPQPDQSLRHVGVGLGSSASLPQGVLRIGAN